jgi:hypothetical protein
MYKVWSDLENGYMNLEAEVQFFLTIANAYRGAAKILIASSIHPSDNFVGYPLELLFATSFELYIKSLIASNYILENKNKALQREEIDQQFRGYSHDLIKLFNYKNLRQVLGITNLRTENDNAHISHIEIETNDPKFPMVTLKNSESSRYAPNLY